MPLSVGQPVDSRAALMALFALAAEVVGRDLVLAVDDQARHLADLSDGLRFNPSAERGGEAAVVALGLGTSPSSSAWI